MAAGQVLVTFSLGVAFFVCRRISGTLVLAMAAHGSWDFSLFLPSASDEVLDFLGGAAVVALVVMAAVVVRQMLRTEQTRPGVARAK